MKKTLIMGIVNATPDSFYSQNRFRGLKEALQHALKIADEGADILDIGGESTRPGAKPVEIEEELDRVIPLIVELKKHCTLPLSIDTRKPKVAAAAIKAGASYINDVEGLRDPAMREVASSAGVQVCVIHMSRNPETMQNNPHYEEGIIHHLEQWFDNRIKELVKSGIQEKQIILDPGIGFGKTAADNFTILRNLIRLKTLGFPILLGISRKSFMGKSPEERHAQTLALNALAINEKVDIIRVHDVADHRAVVDVLHTQNLGCKSI